MFERLFAYYLLCQRHCSPLIQRKFGWVSMFVSRKYYACAIGIYAPGIRSPDASTHDSLSCWHNKLTGANRRFACRFARRWNFGVRLHISAFRHRRSLSSVVVPHFVFDSFLCHHQPYVYTVPSSHF